LRREEQNNERGDGNGAHGQGRPIRYYGANATSFRPGTAYFPRMPQTFKAHPKHPAVPYLARLHADIGGRILENRKQAHRLVEDMKHVEAVLRMYDPNYNVAGIIGRRRINGNPWFKRGTLFRGAIDALRTAAKPLSAREMVMAMIAAKGIKNPPAARVRSLTGGVTNSLRNNEGKTVERVGEGSPMRWRLIT